MKAVKQFQRFATRVYRNVLDLDVESSYPNQISMCNISKDTTERKLYGVNGHEHEEIRDTLMDVVTGPVGAARFMVDVCHFPKLTEIGDMIKEMENA